MSKVSQLVVLASGNGSNLQAILNACAGNQLAARVMAVFANRRNAYALERAKLAGIAAHYVPLSAVTNLGGTRHDYDADLARQVQAYTPDWVILAGWMHILSSAFLQHFPNRVVNLHPALPGQFPGTDAMGRAFAAYQRGEIIATGCMIHLVPDEMVDAGPVIAQAQVPIYPNDSLSDLEARMHTTEHGLLLEALTKLVGANKPLT